MYVGNYLQKYNQLKEKSKQWEKRWTNVEEAGDINIISLFYYYD